MKKYIPHIIWCIIIFYLVPVFVGITPVIAGLPEMFSLLINMVLLFIGCIFFGRKRGFKLLLPIISILVFIPSGFIFEYAPLRIGFASVMYLIASIFGNITGLMFRKK
ncbi:MAG: hypothetical protein IJO08_01040 [Clostridia bacterium]|nr:hypothetical protein [Clostridia bacterium]